MEAAELNKLASVTERINAGLTLEDVLNYSYEAFHDILPYERISFALLEDRENKLSVEWVRSTLPVRKLAAGYSAPLGKSLQQLVSTGRPRIINDLENYLREHPDSESTRDILAEGMRSSLTCPLISLGKPFGVLFFSSVQSNAYTDSHVESFARIADQVALIAQKSRMYEELLHLNKLKNRFLGIAAHDLRSPLVVLRSYLELFLQGTLGPVSAQQSECMSIMDRNCERMLGLIDDLLDVNVIESGKLELKREQIDFSALIAQRCAFYALAARKKRLELILEIPPHLDILCDPARVVQVIDNLMSNAIKFSSDGGFVKVAVETADEWVQVSVCDSGPGIPEDEKVKLFTDFGKTTVRPTMGESSTGLGLAICRRLINAHGGRIWVESVPGKGSTFRFKLPALKSRQEFDGCVRTAAAETKYPA